MSKSSNDAVNQLHEAWQSNDFIANFNNLHEIRVENVVDYECMWYGKEAKQVLAVMTFIDTEELLKNMPLVVGGFVKISYTSQEHTKIGKPLPFSKDFYITKVRQVKEDERNAVSSVTIEMIDIVSQKLKSDYSNKAFPETKPMTVFEEVLEKFKIPDLEFLPDLTEAIVNITVPAHKNAFDFFTDELSYRGYNFIQDKFKKYLVHDTDITDSKAASTGEYFEYKPSLEHTRFQVLAYNGEGFNLSALEESVPVDMNKINNENQNQKEMDIAIEVAKVDTTKLATVSLKDRVNVSGFKQGNTYNKNNSTEMKNLKEAQEMSIWVPGCNNNKIGMKIEVEMPRPAEYKQNTDDPSLSGKWVVNKVRDKIIRSYFIQELYLSRAGK